jgi:hypothetical protein
LFVRRAAGGPGPRALFPPHRNADRHSAS